MNDLYDKSLKLYCFVHKMFFISSWFVSSTTCHYYYQHCHWQTYRARQKSNPLGKILYVWNCRRFFHQIYSVYRRGFIPHILQILLQ